MATAKKTAAKTAAKSTPAKQPASTALATTNKNTDVASPADIADLISMSAGSAQQGIGRDDLAIPRIAILQSGSPQVKKSEPLYMKGAEEGDFYDNVAIAVISKGEEGFLFVPAAYRRANLEWIPKNQGGGFIADHGKDDSILLRTKKNEETGGMMLPNGHEIVTTAEYVGLILDLKGNVRGQAAISLAKTQLKKAKRLNTLLTTLQVPNPNGVGTLNPAMCYSYFKVTSVPESNDKGSWMGWKFERAGDTLKLGDGPNLFRSALSLMSAVQSGSVQVAAPEANHSGGGSSHEDESDTL